MYTIANEPKPRKPTLLSRRKKSGLSIKRSSRKNSGQSETDDWRIVDPYDIVKSDTSLTTFINGCMNKWAKLSFIIKCINSCPLKQLKFGPSGVKMLGKRYTKYEEFSKDYSQLIYLSYRQGMKTPLMRTDNDAYTQDTSKKTSLKIDWGCSIRSSQMLFAEIVQRLITPKKNSISLEERKRIKKSVLREFFDNFSSALSIHNICQKGRKYDAKIGEYWRPLTAILCLGTLCCDEILDNFDNTIIYSLSNNKENVKRKRNFSKRAPRELLDDLKVPNFTMVLCKNNMVDFKNIKMKMKGDFLLDQSVGPSTLLEKPVLVIIVAMFGNTNINHKNFRALGKLITRKSCVGFIGGVQRQAYYIIGQHQESMMILDPHDVNSSENRNLRSYQPHPDARLVKFTEFNSCLNLGFLLKTEEDFLELETAFAKITDDLKDEFYVSTIFDSEKYRKQFNEAPQATNCVEKEGDYAFFNDSDEMFATSTGGIEADEDGLPSPTMTSMCDSFIDIDPSITKTRKMSDDYAFELVEEEI